MKAKLLHFGSEWLEGDYEPPPPLLEESYLNILHIDREPRLGLDGMKILGKGTGVWDGQGNLRHFTIRGADVSWCRKSGELLSLENTFGTCRQQKGIRHVLKRLDSSSFDTVKEMDICVTTGGCEYLVLNHEGDRCAVTWLDQSDWGYVVADVMTMTQLPLELARAAQTLSPPQWSPDDKFIVSCDSFRDGWWTDAIDNYWENASAGGGRKVGTISVHDVTANLASQHDVIVDLPSGWRPMNGDAPEWQGIWGPQFTSQREFVFWLPDESTEMLTLPLKEHIVIKRELRQERPSITDG